MPLNLIVTGDDCGEGDLSKSYGRHLFNWGIDFEKDAHTGDASCYKKQHTRSTNAASP